MKVDINMATRLILKIKTAILINLNPTQFIIHRVITHPTHQESLQTIILTKMS